MRLDLMASIRFVMDSGGLYEFCLCLHGWNLWFLIVFKWILIDVMMSSCLMDSDWYYDMFVFALYTNGFYDFCLCLNWFSLMLWFLIVIEWMLSGVVVSVCFWIDSDWVYDICMFFNGLMAFLISACACMGFWWILLFLLVLSWLLMHAVISECV